MKLKYVLMFPNDSQTYYDLSIMIGMQEDRSQQILLAYLFFYSQQQQKLHNMGNEQSNQYDGCTTLGYRVLGVQPQSPASLAGLVSFFDFLVGVNGQLLFDNGEHGESGGEYFEDLDFVAFLKDHVDQEIELLVWNIKNKSQRFINLTPTTNWEGTGLLGVTIRMDDYVTAEDNLLRILDVQPGSPAARAGMSANKDDYLLGTTMESFENEAVLGDVLYENEDQELQVYVYNTETDVVKVVTIVPSLNWDGAGLLGAEVGRGFLHRLPQTCRKSLGASFERKVTIGANDEIVQAMDKNDINDANLSAYGSYAVSGKSILEKGSMNSKELVETTLGVIADGGKEAVKSELNLAPEANREQKEFSKQNKVLETDQPLQHKMSAVSIPLNIPLPSALDISNDISDGVQAIALLKNDDLPPPPIIMIDGST
jgi:hypothetical protein